MTKDETRETAHRLAKELDATEDLSRMNTLARELVVPLTEYWDAHPHSAMEMLEWCVIRLPLLLAHALVRNVVIAWKRKSTYDPTAGRSADHCYMSALLLSENLDLADRPWLNTVLPRTLDKELKYPRFDRMRDADAKKALVRAAATSIGYKSVNT